MGTTGESAKLKIKKLFRIRMSKLSKMSIEQATIKSPNPAAEVCPRNWANLIQYDREGLLLARIRVGLVEQLDDLCY